MIDRCSHGHTQAQPLAYAKPGACAATSTSPCPRGREAGAWQWLWQACQACSAHTRAKNTKGSSVKVSGAGIVTTRVIMTHQGQEDPAVTPPHGFLGKVKVLPCSLVFCGLHSTAFSV